MYEIPQLSQKCSFIRSTTIAGIGVAVLGLAGCAPKKPAASEGAARAYTAGTYTASSQGKFAFPSPFRRRSPTRPSRTSR